jgi:hypothetical protein
MRQVNEFLRYLRDPESGVRLGQNEYTRDFEARSWLTDGADSWKLERMQFYDETGFPSWDAFAAGDWIRSLELYAGLCPELRSFYQRYTAHGAHFRRIRVIETPIAPYMQWELHCLRVRAECGERTRVVLASGIAGLESSVGPLPELVSLCGTTLYVTVYGAAAVPDGGRRFTDPEVIARYEELARGLYASGEDLEAYFAREIAPLPPPSWASAYPHR